MHKLHERYLAWFQSGAAMFFSVPVSVAVMIASYRSHAGPYRWLMELQGAVLGGRYSVVVILAIIFLATHLLACMLLSLIGLPPKVLRDRKPFHHMVHWYQHGTYSFYGLVLGLTFLVIAVASGTQAWLAGDLVLGKPSALASASAAPTWAYIDGAPQWQWTVTKEYKTYVAYVDEGNDGSGPGVIVVSGGGLGLQQMQTADKRKLGIEAMRPWDGIPPDVRAAFVERGMAWASDAPAYDFGHSPLKHKQHARLFLGLGLLLFGLGFWRRPR